MLWSPDKTHNWWLRSGPISFSIKKGSQHAHISFGKNAFSLVVVRQGSEWWSLLPCYFILCGKLFQKVTLLKIISISFRIIMCMLCGDPFSVENVLGPLLSHQSCALSGDRSLTLETVLGDSKRKVEVIMSSYHRWV